MLEILRGMGISRRIPWKVCFDEKKKKNIFVIFFVIIGNVHPQALRFLAGFFPFLRFSEKLILIHVSSKSLTKTLKRSKAQDLSFGLPDFFSNYLIHR